MAEWFRKPKQWHRLCERSHWYTAGSCICLGQNRGLRSSAGSDTHVPRLKALWKPLHLPFWTSWGSWMYVTIRIYHHFTTCFEQNRLNWSICFVREHIPQNLKLDTGHLLFSDYDSSFFVLNQIGRNYDFQNRFQHVPAMFNKFSICICHHMSPQLIATLISGCAWPFLPWTRWQHRIRNLDTQEQLLACTEYARSGCSCHLQSKHVINLCSCILQHLLESTFELEAFARTEFPLWKNTTARLSRLVNSVQHKCNAVQTCTDSLHWKKNQSVSVSCVIHNMGFYIFSPYAYPNMPFWHQCSQGTRVP